MEDKPTRPLCPTCWRPLRVCYCHKIEQLDTRTRVLILQHPRERKVGVNTARMAKLCLPNSELRRGVDFSGDPFVREALHNSAQPAALLFPGAGSLDLLTSPPQGPLTLVVLDGTWWQASKLLKSNPEIAALPRYALTSGALSRYRIRRQPEEHCLATIEALAAVLGVLEQDPERMQRLLIPFESMVEAQLRFSSNPQSFQRLPRKRREAAVPSVLRDRPESIVLACGELNEWGRGTNGPLPELIHWVAERPHTGDRFEAVLRPRAALAPSCCHHARLERQQLEQGEEWGSFVARWQGFLGAEAVVCQWGHFAGDVLRRQGVELGARLDLRIATLRQLGPRAGDLSVCAQALRAQPEAPWAQGRAGRRLAILVAIAAALRSVLESDLGAQDTGAAPQLDRHTGLQ